MNIQNALIVSAAIHGACLAALFKAPPPGDVVVKKDISVDYVALKEPLKNKTPLTDSSIKIPETPSMPVKSEVSLEPDSEASSSMSGPDKTAPRDAAKRPSHDQALLSSSAAQDRIKTTKDYINYYQLLREKIRQRVKRSYRSYYGEGEARVNFELRANGSLVSCDADDALSTDDSTLVGLAVSSVRAASPFPPFPKALSLPNMKFSVTIIFKKNI